jgi:hypothetical protein
MANPIIGPLPVILMDGQIADAVAVMADFNYIVSQVNSNAAGSTGNFTEIGIFGGVGGGNLTTATTYAIGTAPFPTNTVNGDIYSEYNATTGIFTPINSGTYLLVGTVNVNINGATITQSASLAGFVQNAWVGAFGLAYFQSPLAGTFSMSSATIAQTCPMIAGQTLQLKTFNQFAFTGGPVQSNVFFMNIIRVR